MFNLLGSIFGYGAVKSEIGDDNECSTTTAAPLQQIEQASTVNMATQTMDESTIVSAEAAVAPVSAVSTNPADWVIVDRTEEAERCGESRTSDATTSTSMIQSRVLSSPTVEPARERNSLTESVPNGMLGSFFDKHQTEDAEFNRKYGASNAKPTTTRTDDEDMMQATTSKDWLITPLPCLTSITASQRSIENDPLENLLIEHPSMSVFVAATSSSSSSDDSFAEEEEMHVDEVKPVVVAALKEVEKNVVVLSKSVSEKRKVSSPTPSLRILNSDASPSATLKRRGKKNKRAANSSPSTTGVQATAVTATAPSPSANNKENLQVLVANDYKKQANAARLESLLLNKNQMKRANKNSTFACAGAKSANAKHRKYHKLQQPAFFTSKPVF